MSLRPKPKTDKERRTIDACPISDTEGYDEALARVMTRPEVRAARTLRHHDTNAMLDVTSLTKELEKQIRQVTDGDLTRAEATLVAQAGTLDELFNQLARLSFANLAEGHLDATDRFMRLALKAQGQCVRTLEVLSTIKNPPVLFAKQANVTTGPQQINNGTSTENRNAIGSHAEVFPFQQTQLSGEESELLPDARAPGLARGVSPPLEAVGKVHRAEDNGG